MVVNLVQVHVKPEHVRDFIDATLKNHVGTRTEPGNLRFDVLQSNQDPARFTLYEVFASPEAVEAHRQTPHYQTWKRTVEAYMALPRQAHLHTPLAPTDREKW